MVMSPKAPGPRLSKSIQPVGAIIGVKREGDRITHVSETMADVMGQPLSTLVGASLASILPRELLHELRNILSLSTFPHSRHFAGRFETPKGPQDVSVSYSAATGHAVLEYEPATMHQHTSDDFAAELHHLSIELRRAESADALVKAFAALLRIVAGYDSALIYRFDQNKGKFITEARQAAQPKLLGQHVPFLEGFMKEAAYLRPSILHLVADADAKQSAIRTIGDASPELDLSLCDLCSPSEDAAYGLKALGANASVALPLFKGKKLWGLCLLLSRRAKRPSRYIRQLCNALAPLVSDRLDLLPFTTDEVSFSDQRGEDAQLARKVGHGR